MLVISAAYGGTGSSDECRAGSFPGLRVALEYCTGDGRAASERVAARWSVGWDHGSHRQRIAVGEGALTAAEILMSRIRHKQSAPTGQSNQDCSGIPIGATPALGNWKSLTVTAQIPLTPSQS